MQLPENLILVCTGEDSRAAARCALPLLQLCIGAGPNGALSRLCLPAHSQGCYLGVSDLGLDGSIPRFCAEALLHEAQKNEMQGIFADFERDVPAVHTLLRQLDALLHPAGLPLFVPLCQAEHVKYAELVVETALSGGSLDDRFRELMTRYPGRIAAALRPVSADFSLPAEDGEGAPCTAEERQALQAAHGAQAFFSRELCAKYFTYMDDEQAGHFVLFDDASTIETKLHRLSALGITRIFALYPDVSPFLPAMQ